MQRFDVDDEVVEAVWQLAKARPFESFNSALRRVLRLTGDAELAETSATDSALAPVKWEEMHSPAEPATNPVEDLPGEDLAARPRSKAPKADLRELVRAGLLRNGEELFLLDYHGARLQQFKATISSGGVVFKGQHYSMSDLARDLLKKVGYQSDSVRGPAHWSNARGATVKDLWQQLLDKRAQK